MTRQSETRTVYDYIKSNWQNTIRYEPDDQGTLLGLPFPYTVPCQSEKTMQNYFYWDTYFTNVGLLLQGFVDLARNNADNLLFLLRKYGFVPNGNCTYFLNRSQPPYLALMVREIFDRTGDKTWLHRAYDALKVEYDFWDKKRSTPVGLNRHFHHATAEELHHFIDHDVKDRVPVTASDPAGKIRAAEHYLAEAETGWDFTPRFEGRASDFVPVDLNSLLYQVELNLARFSQELGIGEEAHWLSLAEARRTLFSRFLWDEENGFFYDYDFVPRRRSAVASLAGFHPLWTRMATPAQAEAVRSNLSKFEFDFGMAVCEQGGRSSLYQWDFPNGWPPLYYIVIQGLRNYGYEQDARRIAGKFVRVVSANFQATGDLWEKYNAVDGSIRVINEYDMPAMLGWTAGVFVHCIHFLEQ